MDKIFVDASEPAAIVFEGNVEPIPALTLQEAVIALAKLDDGMKEIASIKTHGGRTYSGADIERLYRK